MINHRLVSFSMSGLLALVASGHAGDFERQCEFEGQLTTISQQAKQMTQAAKKTRAAQPTTAPTPKAPSADEQEQALRLQLLNIHIRDQMTRMFSELKKNLFQKYGEEITPSSSESLNLETGDFSITTIVRQEEGTICADRNQFGRAYKSYSLVTRKLDVKGNLKTGKSEEKVTIMQNELITVGYGQCP